MIKILCGPAGGKQWTRIRTGIKQKYDLDQLLKEVLLGWMINPRLELFSVLHRLRLTTVKIPRNRKMV